ncbi:hypothetical protein KCP71_16705 [Salmonella enterica subsp. enterica]|nr:hypothetical protein KCP71_16705 [Salmonella enterica subsp. enterica]
MKLICAAARTVEILPLGLAMSRRAGAFAGGRFPANSATRATRWRTFAGRGSWEWRTLRQPPRGRFYRK